MSRIVVVYTLLAFLSSSLLENVAAQDSWNFIKSLDALTMVVETLETKIDMQARLLNSLVTQAEMQGNSLDSLASKAEIYKNSFDSLEAKISELKTLLINSTVKEDEQIALLSHLDAKANMQEISLEKLGATLKNHTSFLYNFESKEAMHADNSTNMVANVTTFCDRVETFTEKIQNLRASKGITEGIIAGTTNGIVIVPLDSREQRTIANDDTTGVAFNWKNRKVYWIKYVVGIQIADLDGSSVELLISDTSVLWGLAVDQITGNFYYGVRGSSPSIRVCDSRGKKCVTVASGVNTMGISIHDIALIPNQGLMFWSSPSDKKSVTRANMDGTNATVTILEEAFGLYVDEFSEKLYCANRNGKSIGHRDLNGNNRFVMLNTSIYPNDIAIDRDTLYFGGYSPHGVYSLTSDRKVSLIANITGQVYHVALYGRNQVPSRPNPCENSPCANLCVLTQESYTCL